jgi:phenylalanyl-tRNA synthetase alpha subunit
MRKLLLTITAIGIFGIASFAQAKNDTIQQLQNSIEKLEGVNNKLTVQLNTANSNIQKIEKKLSATADSLNILKENLANTNNNLQTIADNLGVKIQQTSEKASADFSSLNAKVGKNTLYWIIAVLFIALLSVLLFGWLKKQLSKEKIGLSDQIKKTSETLRDEQIKLDGQLIKLLDTQMQLMNAERQASSAKAEEIDHSLALKVADEIVRIEKNINRLEGNEKEIKPILKGLERIRDNFAASGYEMVQLLNKEYDDRMNVDVINFINDKNIPTGKRIITKVIRPQVNFQGVLKQKAQVDVSQN